MKKNILNLTHEERMSFFKIFGIKPETLGENVIRFTDEEIKIIKKFFESPRTGVFAVDPKEKEHKSFSSFLAEILKNYLNDC